MRWGFRIVINYLCVWLIAGLLLFFSAKKTQSDPNQNGPFVLDPSGVQSRQLNKTELAQLQVLFQNYTKKIKIKAGAPQKVCNVQSYWSNEQKPERPPGASEWISIRKECKSVMEELSELNRTSGKKDDCFEDNTDQYYKDKNFKPFLNCILEERLAFLPKQIEVIRKYDVGDISKVIAIILVNKRSFKKTEQEELEDYMDEYLSSRSSNFPLATEGQVAPFKDEYTSTVGWGGKPDLNKVPPLCRDLMVSFSCPVDEQKPEDKEKDKTPVQPTARRVGSYDKTPKPKPTMRQIRRMLRGSGRNSDGTCRPNKDPNCPVNPYKKHHQKGGSAIFP